MIKYSYTVAILSSAIQPISTSDFNIFALSFFNFLYLFKSILSFLLKVHLNSTQKIASLNSYIFTELKSQILLLLSTLISPFIPPSEPSFMPTIKIVASGRVDNILKYTPSPFSSKVYCKIIVKVTHV